jgi:hypothetical protein
VLSSIILVVTETLEKGSVGASFFYTYRIPLTCIKLDRKNRVVAKLLALSLYYFPTIQLCISFFFFFFSLCPSRLRGSFNTNSYGGKGVIPTKNLVS